MSRRTWMEDITLRVCLHRLFWTYPQFFFKNGSQTSVDSSKKCNFNIFSILHKVSTHVGGSIPKIKSVWPLVDFWKLPCKSRFFPHLQGKYFPISMIILENVFLLFLSFCTKFLHIMTKRKERIYLHKKRFGVVNFSSFWQFYSYFCKRTPFSAQNTSKNQKLLQNFFLKYKSFALEHFFLRIVTLSDSWFHFPIFLRFSHGVTLQAKCSSGWVIHTIILE
jgi:hypothetical protein